jgi:hypothetical protein
MPGTGWEAWDGNATFADGSKNHIFKLGGIGTYLYESALGLTFAYGPAPAAAAAAECPRARSLPFSFDVAARTRLPCRVLSAVADVVEERLLDETARADGSFARIPLAELEGRIRAALGKEGGSEEEEEAPALIPLLGLVVDASIARRAGGASGWRQTPEGKISFAWTYAGPEGQRGAVVLSARAVVPHTMATTTLLELPLSLLGPRRSAGNSTVVITSRRPLAGAGGPTRTEVTVEVDGNGVLRVDGGSGVRLASSGTASLHARRMLPLSDECSGGTCGVERAALILEVRGGGAFEWEVEVE